MITAFIPRFLLICCLLLFVWGGFYFSNVRVVEIKMDSAIQNSDKNKYFKNLEKKLNSYKGIPLWRVDLKKITEEVKQSYPFGDIHVVRQWPHRITVFLNQIQPILLIFKKDKFYSVSYDGSLQVEITSSQSLDFPVLRGKALWDSKSLRKHVINFLTFLPQKGPLTMGNISEISYNDRNKSFLFYLIPYGFLLEWKGELYDKKIQNINFVLNYMQGKGGSRYHIDARFPRKIIVNKSK